MTTVNSRTIKVYHQKETIEYKLRGLHENEVDKWATFCASVFSYKANPPPSSYFERHYHNDPRRDASLIRIILYDGKIVSSCRIFLKTISSGMGSSAIEAGGIGEVCTSPLHRKRGLSKLLLHDALDIMKCVCKVSVSFLHSAPDFFPVYERGGGYASTVSPWSLLTLDARQLHNCIGDTQFRLAKFPNDVKRLQVLHQKYSEQRFAGCIVRSVEYWNDYLSKELDGKMHVLTKSMKDQDVLAWMAIRSRGNYLQLVDFGYDASSLNSKTQKNVLWQLFAHCYSNCNTFCEKEASPEKIKLHLPKFVSDDLKEAVISTNMIISSEDANDLGWMYVTLQEGSIDMVKTTETIPHLIWPSDSF